MNGFYEVFLKEIGPGIQYQEVPDAFLEKYRDILPKGLLEFWREQGWCSYADGIFWTVNPEEYTWVLEDWIKDCVDVPVADYFIFARNAYGEFYCLSLDAGCTVKISCPWGLIVAAKELKKTRRASEQAAQTFFAMASLRRFDMLDCDGTPMFPAALTKLGPVGHNEIYGFVPMITLGFEPTVAHLEKVRMDVHLDILRTSVEPKVQFV